uniref:Uncharacterized protein n=1 Tax=mine drainage metagenome TaxID=410659 RepID=E6QML8_9ZZZZ
MPANQQNTQVEATSYLLVMTATVTPAPQAGVRRADPVQRLEDYQRTLRFWLHYPHRVAANILLLENSGADLNSLRRIVETENSLEKSVEILSIPGNRIPDGLNYGYTEMELLDEGLTRSKLRQSTTHMVKTTGRLTFPALGRAIDLVRGPFELMVDCRKLGFPRRGYDASVQLFVCSHEFYDEHLRHARRFLNTTDVRLLEHLIYRQVIGSKGQPGIHLRFPCNIDPVGYSGFKAQSYRTTGQRLDQAVRGILRRVAPWYWY